jgi:hypothetical protein
MSQTPGHNRTSKAAPARRAVPKTVLKELRMERDPPLETM